MIFKIIILLLILTITTGDWGLGIGDWGLGIGQSPIPNPQSPVVNKINKSVKFNSFNNNL